MVPFVHWKNEKGLERERERWPCQQIIYYNLFVTDGQLVVVGAGFTGEDRLH